MSQSSEHASGKRLRRPSEKVQAMLEDQAYDKVSQQEQASAKAKKQDERLRKRDQAAKAAQLDPFKTPRALPVETTATPASADEAFSSRMAGGLLQVTPRASLGHTVSLVPRKGKVPPVPAKNTIPQLSLGHTVSLVPRKGKVPPVPARNTIPQLPPRVHVLTPSQSIRYEGLKNKGIPPVVATNATTVARGVKRVYDRQATPYPESLAFNEHDNTATEFPVPRKRSRYIVHSDDDNTADTTTQSADGNAPKSSSAANGLSHSRQMFANVNNSRSGHGGASSRKRVKAGDLDPVMRATFETAVQIYHVYMLTENPFPPADVELDWAKKSWDAACDHQKAGNIPYDTDIIKMIEGRSSHFRGQFKTKACSITTSTFGFESGTSPDVQERNRQLAVDLKTRSTFLFREHNPRSGIYRNRVIQQVINEILFKSKTAEGIKWADYYRTFPLPGFALTLTAIECAIDEWASGSHEAIAFTEATYSGLYKCHLDTLEFFQDKTRSTNIVPTIMKQVYEIGRKHSGVRALPATDSRALDFLPDGAIEEAIEEFEQETLGSVPTGDFVEADEVETDVDDRPESEIEVDESEVEQDEDEDEDEDNQDNEMDEY